MANSAQQFSIAYAMFPTKLAILNAECSNPTDVFTIMLNKKPIRCSLSCTGGCIGIRYYCRLCGLDSSTLINVLTLTLPHAGYFWCGLDSVSRYLR